MWLIADHVAQELRAARASLPAPTAEQRDRFVSRIGELKAALRDSGPRSLTVAGDTAEIRIEGVLTEELDFWLWLMDEPNTAYEDLRAAIAAAESDNTIRKVVFYVDSPGGNVDGLFETVAAMQTMTKPSSVRSRCACSAAYALAAVGGKIEAVNHAAMFGSVGVVVSYLLWDDLKVIDITSTEAPEKRPNPETPEGQASIRKFLDALHGLMAEGIAAGRGTTVEAVNAGYGRGAVMLAADAKKAGMIDKISGKRPGEAGSARASSDDEPAQAVPPVAPNSAPQAATETGAQEKHMDLNELKAKHRDLYEAVVAEGEKAGESKERRRATAHAKMAKRPGCADIALKAIEEGTPFADDVVQSGYLEASMNARDAQARTKDEEQAAKAADGASAPAAGKTFAEQVVAEMAARKGK